MRVASRCWILPALFFLDPGEGHAQAELRLDEFQSCECELPLRAALALGDVDGPGIVESGVVRVAGMGGRGFIVHP